MISYYKDIRSVSWRNRRLCPECGMLGNKILEAVLTLINEVKSSTPFISSPAKSLKINIIN